MNLRELNAFIVLAETLHFAKAAAAIHVSASTLSRMMQRLEEEFSQTFFVRDNRKVELTKEGERFVEFARDVVQQWRQLKNDFEAENQSISGALIIYCTVTAAHLYLTHILAEFRQRYPKVEVILETGDVAQAFGRVSERLADVAFAVAPESLPKKYQFRIIDTIPLKVIAPVEATYFSTQGLREAADLINTPFVMPESGPAKKHVDDWFNRLNIKPHVYAQVSGHEAIVSMTALGCGVSVVPLPVLEHSPVKDKVKTLAMPLLPKPFELGVVSLKNRFNEPVVRAFYDLVNELY